MRLHPKNKYTFLIVVFCCLNMQCKKEREIDKLPDATTTGNGAFGCLINGRAWPVYEKGNQNYFLFYHAGRLDIAYTVYAIDGSDYERIVISSDKVKKPGIYWIKNDDDNFFTISYRHELYLSNSDINLDSYLYLNISCLDSLQRIVSGTFSFSLYNYWGTKKISVDEGRFDLRY
ncbi:MAG TPA: hypothetical protein VK202_09075 [Bacteroidia bacterium]|nr:hypothetical protein [Bacteroidia bacterium]